MDMEEQKECEISIKEEYMVTQTQHWPAARIFQAPGARF